MQKCTLTLLTAADGRETRESHTAEMELNGSSALLRYEESGASVCISLRKGEASIEREGEYGMNLPLREGVTTQGVLTLGGASGTLDAYTERVEYAVKPTGLFFRLQYSLLFDKERQEMRVSGHAKINGEK